MDLPLEFTIVAITYAVALATALALTPLARRAALAWRIIDRPDGDRKLQSQAVPLLGGIAVYSSWILALAALSVALPHVATSRFLLVALGLCVLAAAGVCDDIWNLRARWKLAAQIVASLPIVGAGYVVQRVGLFGHHLNLGVLAVPLTIAWLVACANAVNLIDGMDGLASLVGWCIGLAALVLGFLTGSFEAMAMAAALVGVLTGFLVFNRPAAKIYLGDAGSMVIGLMLGLLALDVSHDSSRTTNLTVLASLMALPLGDMGLAVVRRILSGRGIWQPDRGHVHHQLLERGFGVGSVLALMGGLSAAAAALAVLTCLTGNEAIAWCAGGAAAIALVTFRLAGHVEWSMVQALLASDARIVKTFWPTPEELSVLPFETVWAGLVKMAGDVPIARIEMNAGMPGRQARYHHWNATAPAGNQDQSIVHEIEFSSASEGWCRVKLAVIDPVDWSTIQPTRFLQALHAMGKHWALRPEAVPIDAPFAHEDGPSSIPFPPKPVDWWRSRAA